MPSPWLGSGFDGFVGAQWDEVTATGVRGRLTVREEHLQPYGIVHGGVYSAVADSAAVAGAQAGVDAHEAGVLAMSVENHTTFVRAVRAGTELAIEATPLQAGRRTQSWQVAVREATTGRDVAASRVRVVVTPPGG